MQKTLAKSMASARTIRSAKTSPKTCPIAQASSLVGDMWVILIVRDLLKGSKRFTELQHSLIPYLSETSINTRTLTDRLKMLEETDIVTRIAYEHEMPPRVEYTLTKKGQALSEIIEKIKEYGQEHF